MHEQVVHVARCGLFVRLSAEASKSFLVDVHAQWIRAVNENVDSQIILQVIHKMRSVQVVLDDPTTDTFFLMSLLNVVHDSLHSAAEKDALALRQTIRLHNERLSVLLAFISWLIKLVSEVDIVSR